MNDFELDLGAFEIDTSNGEFFDEHAGFFPESEFDGEFESESDEAESEQEFRRRPQAFRGRPRVFRRAGGPKMRPALRRPFRNRFRRAQPARPRRPGFRPRRFPGRPAILRRRLVGIRRPHADCICPAHGAEFIRWVQSSLNQVLGLNLPVNGIIGPASRNAVRTFQQREGLQADGIAGPETEKALIAARSGQSTGASVKQPVEPPEPAPGEPAATAEPPEPTEPTGLPETTGSASTPEGKELDEIGALLDEMDEAEVWGSRGHYLDEFEFESESSAYPGISCVTPGNPYVLHCFPAFKTELTKEQHHHLDIVAEKIRRSFSTSRPITKVMIVGHSSTWHETSRSELEERAAQRAGNAAEQLILRLQRIGLSRRVAVEADGRSDSVKWRGKPYSSTSGSQKAQNDRALNRRVEIRLVAASGSTPGWSVIENAPSGASGIGAVLLTKMQESGGLCGDQIDPDPLVGDDDRRPVTDTRRAPYRWICKLISVFPPDSSGDRQAGGGTGFLINSDTIVTAGHNLDHPELGIPDFVFVMPGLNKRTPFGSSKFSSATAPFGAFIIPRRSGSTGNLFVSPEWRRARTGEHDYGLIRLRNRRPLLSGSSLDDGWNTVSKGLADVSVANVERQKRRPATPEEIVRLLRLHTGQIAVTGYSGDRPCRQLGMRGGRVRKLLFPDRSSHNAMESFLDTTAGNSGSPYWIMKDRTEQGRRRQQHILVGIHRGGIFPFHDRDPSSKVRVASRMVVITPEVWRRLTNRSLLHAL